AKVDSVEIHGYASAEGPPGDYNINLSCKRAAAILQAFQDAGVTVPISVFAHGPTTAYGGASLNRNVVVTLNSPGPTPPSSSPCPALPKPIPGTCSGRHDGYVTARKCFRLNPWLACADQASADVCRAVAAFNFQGQEGS